MAYDETRGQVVLFGGMGAAPLGDLWAWNGRSWTQLASTGPLPRDAAVLAYDSRRQRLVMYGGRTRDASGERALTDTWEWDGAAWTQRDTFGPGPRVHAVGAFDGSAGRLVVYGGVDAAGQLLEDTWEWDGQRWVQRSSVGPPGCIPNAMAYHPTRGAVLMLCIDENTRRADGTYDTDLWEWRGTWLPIGGEGPVLSPIQAMTSLGGAELLLLDGAAQGDTAFTWRWDGSRWSRLDVPGPARRAAHALAYDSARQRGVLFGGGQTVSDFADTWEWDGTRWLQVNLP